MRDARLYQRLKEMARRTTRENIFSFDDDDIPITSTPPAHTTSAKDTNNKDES